VQDQTAALGRVAADYSHLPGNVPVVVPFAAEAGVIGVVGIDLGRIWAADGHHDIVENRDRIAARIFALLPPSVTLETKLSWPLLPEA